VEAVMFFWNLNRTCLRMFSFLVVSY